MEDLSDKEILSKILEDIKSSTPLDQILDREGTKIVVGKIKKLDLSDLEITSIPDALFYLSELEQLDVSHNYLTDLPPFLSEMESLMEVKLNENELPNLNYLDIIGSDRKKNELLELRKRACSWCGKEAGFQEEKGKIEGEMGVTTNLATLLICNYCNHIEFFSKGTTVL